MRLIIAAAKGNTYTMNRKINPQYTDEQIDDIIEKLYHWAYEEDGLYIASFTWEHYKKTNGWLNNLADHHPEIKEALVEVKQLLAAKVAKHSWIGDRNSTFGEKLLPMYSKEYKELKEWQANLNKTQEKGDTLTIQDIIKLSKAGDLLKAMAQPDEDKTS